MGIGNTTAASAVVAALTGLPPEAVTGTGTGVDPEGRARKVDVIGRALAVNRPDPADGVDVLAKVGGFEIGGLCGVILAGAALRIPVVLDGFITGAAALAAVRLRPEARHYLLASHRSTEPGASHVLDALGLKPFLELDMRLGEGTGSALCIALARAAVKILGEMATFKSAGVSSGVGKTTLMLGLLEALRRRGLTVQAFKVGPDFIDPAFHGLASHRPAVNLDGWMSGRDAVLDAVGRYAAGADVALVEGMMGCFDGRDGGSEEGSTAQIAKWLGAPVVLVVDAGALVRSAGAIVLGFERFDPELRVEGVVFNRVGGARHREWLRQAVMGACRSRVLGALPHAPEVALPERHLGLVTAAEGVYTPALGEAVATLVERELDLDALVNLATSAVERREVAAGPRFTGRPVRVGVALDRAFQFYYAENLDLLRRAGADLVFWSPMDDATLPEVDGLYLGGGYPEIYGERQRQC